MTAEIDLWREYRRTREPKLRDALIERHLALVKYTAMWIAGRLPSHLRVDDLYSAGMLGFLDAVEHYDPERGVSFSAYAGPRIRGAILDDLRRLDCVPRRVRRLIREAERTIESLMHRLGRAPGEEEIASELGMEVGEYRDLLVHAATLLSLNAPVDGDHGSAPIDLLEDHGPNPLSSLETDERRALLGRLIERLPMRERQVLALYYQEDLTMQEVGRVLGLTESRISQIHSSAILRLRTAMRRRRLRPGALGLDSPAAGAPAGRGDAR